MITTRTLLTDLAQHLAREDSTQDVHPDGCLYCGGDHLSVACSADEGGATYRGEQPMGRQRRRRRAIEAT